MMAEVTTPPPAARMPGIGRSVCRREPRPPPGRVIDLQN